jgi:hypothetical protein
MLSLFWARSPDVEPPEGLFCVDEEPAPDGACVDGVAPVAPAPPLVPDEPPVP